MNDAHQLSRRATQASVAVASVLIGLKAWAYFSTGSVSMLGSLLDSVLDGVTALINFLALRYALEPADDEHRYGHGKMESIAALAQSTFMMGSAMVLVLNSFDVMLDDNPVTNSTTGIVVSVIAIILTIVLVSYQKYTLRKNPSLVVEADSLHYQGDVLMNIAVMVAFFFVDFGLFWFDAATAIAIAAFIGYNAFAIGKKSFQDLMDRQLPDVERAVEAIVAKSHGTEGCHDVRCRQAGQNIFVQFHLELDDELTLWSAHEIGDRIEKQIMAAFPNADVIIHHDPVKVSD
ncbi:cation diffusion facilitator family transporter [Bermanella sp. R86510]|uniref:cation diffusion facilitator family transporter n=1 Tax=unclassified Bermanella TaxID=2627862 RepID=UPI0037CC4EA1